MSLQSKLYFNLWRAARLKDEVAFRRHFARGLKTLDNLKTVSAKDLNMFLYAIRIFPPTNKQHWKIIEENVVQNPEYSKKIISLQLISIFSKNQKGSPTFWNQTKSLSQKWLNQLKPYELTSLCVSYSKLDAQRTPIDETDEFWSKAEIAVRNSRNSLNMDNVSSLTWAFGKIRYRNKIFWDFLTSCWIKTPDRMTKGQVARIYWGYARLAKFYQNNHAFSCLEHNLTKYMTKFNDHQLLMVVYSMVIAQTSNQRILIPIEGKITQIIRRVKIDYAVILSYCLAKLKVYNKTFCETFIARVVSHIDTHDKDINVRDLANAAWVVARISQDNEKVDQRTFWNTIESRILSIENSKIQTEALTTFLWSFGRMKKGSTLFWKNLSELVIQRIHELDLEQITIILNPFTYMLTSDNEFWNGIDARCQVLLQSQNINHFYLSKIVRSFSKINKASPGLRSLFVHTFSLLHQRKADMTPIDLFDYILGFSGLKIDTNTLWIQLNEIFLIYKNQLSNERQKEICQQTINKYLNNKKKITTQVWTKVSSKVAS